MEADRPRAADGISTTTAGDAAKGAAGGAGIGLGLGILLGIAAVMIPGVGLVAGSGALVAALAAATGVAGGVAGGIYGFLADLGVPPHNARLLSEHLDNGGVVLHIHTGGSVPETEIMRLLNKYGATSGGGFLAPCLSNKARVSSTGVAIIQSGYPQAGDGGLSNSRPVLQCRALAYLKGIVSVGPVQSGGILATKNPGAGGYLERQRADCIWMPC